MAIESQTLVGKYRIERLLGAGGMGEVYLALDTDLNRPAAIKFLSAEFSTDENRMKRFVREARSASALNHPNIITIYEISRDDEAENSAARFIVTEFIEGETLRSFIKRKNIRLADIIDIAVQIASALAAAHHAGIVHRDIKPENIMIRRDGIVKVLDFGLAKPVEPKTSVETEAATKILMTTNPGAVMGTINYMSPEQASGGEIDARTDIWSLGIVIYEMITGRTPFEGKTPSHTIVNILEKEFAPLSTSVENVPETLEWIVGETLVKDSDERCQTARELLSKLRRLKQRIDTETELERSSAPQIFADFDSRNRLVSLNSTNSAKQTTARSNDFNERQNSVSSAEYIVNQVRRNKLGALTILIIGSLAFTAIAFVVYKFADGRKNASLRQKAAMKITRLTNNGKSSRPAISPDGKYTAYVSQDAGKSSLVLQQIGTAASRELVAPTDGYFNGATFSPDGNFVYYVKGEKGNNVTTLYQVPILGGDSRKLLDDVDTAVSFSPDGKRLTFRRGYFKENLSVLFVANSDGSGEEKVISRKSAGSILSPAWSPDGKTIAYAISDKDENGYFISLNEVNLESKAERQICDERWRELVNLRWLPDGSGLVTAARDRASDPGSPTQLWLIAYPNGEKKKITGDLTEYNNASLAASSPLLIAESRNSASNVWVMPASDFKNPRQIAPGNLAGVEGIAWTPDERIIYTNLESENTDLWIANSDGSGRKQLTFDRAADLMPSVSPDNRYIVFESNRGTGWGIWRMNTDGSNQVELLGNIGRSYPKISADSKWVIYEKSSSGIYTLWKIPIEGGNQIQLTDEFTNLHSLSPDGKWIAYRTRPAEASSPVQVKIISVENGDVAKTFPAPNGAGNLIWLPDSRALSFVKTTDGVSNLWSLSLDGVSQPKQLTEWKTDQIYWFEWSPDGKLLAFSRGNLASDLVLVENFY